MNLEGNTIFITGGSSGIGRAIAEALHARGNKVVIAGRRKEALAETVNANSGIEAVELDVASRDSIARASVEIVRKYPSRSV